MTQFQQDMQIVQHYRDRLKNNIEICECEMCDGEHIADLHETVCEIYGYMDDMERNSL